MPSAITTTVTELPGSRVRVQVEVPPAEVSRQLERKAKALGRELKFPGFRKGKVPTPLVLQRVGREAVLEEAVRDGLNGWYVEALEDSGIAPIGDPRLDLGELPPEGGPLAFSFEVGVVPTAKLGDYKGLDVGRREPVLDPARIEEELEALRARLARLETVARPAGEGDFLVIDYLGSLAAPAEAGGREPDGPIPFAGGEGRDQLVELGAGNLIPGFEEGLLGARAGEVRTVAATFPDPYPPNGDLAGRAASFEVSVKEVKQRELPAIDDELALDAGFDSLDELREEIASHLQAAENERVEAEFREAALDAAVARAQVQVPPALIEARALEVWERTLHRLSRQGISREAYLRIAAPEGEEQVLAEIAPDAERGLRREAVINAVIEAEQIEPGEEDLLEALEPLAEREGAAPAKLLRELQEHGRAQELREEVAARMAMRLLAGAAKAIPIEQARAREELWTPELGRGEASRSEVWTPQSSQGRGGAQPGERLWTPTDPGSTS